jgi:hypothetical protein
MQQREITIHVPLSNMNTPYPALEDNGGFKATGLAAGKQRRLDG